MDVEHNIAVLKERVYEACLRAGRNPAEIRIMAVSKFHTIETAQKAYEGGLTLFGESRVQEAVKKFSPFTEEHPEIEVHMIGSLQRNKARAAAGFFHCIQSTDRDELITELGKHSGERPFDLLLELHTGEDSKSGYPDLDSLCRAAECVLRCPGLGLRGLMTMAPYTQDTKLVRASFRKLARAQGELKKRFPACDWSTLSMGMSNDFETAVEEGATLLRIGTFIFGERQ